jgi:novobiocin biosynthesis protein NovU/D-mycarose 3-C-methyltransferase
MIRERTNCRTCGSKNLTLVLDLGKTALANDFLDPAEAATYNVCLPLRLCICRDCSLPQLADTVDPEVLYSRYAYVSSNSKTMDSHLTEQCEHLLKVGGWSGKPRVLEIASNTGIYLKKFKERGCEVVGVEPAGNISELAVNSGIATRTEFFNAANAKGIAAQWGKADLILGRHVFAHIDDLKDLLAGLDAISHEGTLIAFEVPYAVDFFEKTEFDTIYHEHLSYVSARAVEALVQGSPFFLQRIDHYPIHGGSILFQLRRRIGGTVPRHKSVDEFLAKEDALRLHDPESWKPFAARVKKIQTDLANFVRNLRGSGKRVIGYGASAKGNTLINTAGLTAKDLDYIIDNTPFKQNKLAPGSLIPVRPPETLLRDQPDFAVIFAWNFAAEIVSREVEYQKRGGRFIIPIPELKLVAFS